MLFRSASSFSMPSFMPTGGQIGGFLGNNAGDLAAMLYGLNNNRKQRKALQGQQQQAQQSLESLYGQNSPYAKQLRANLAAKGAASGHRINTGGREVQLQAMLADRAAQHQAALGPQMFQNQMAQGKLQNSMGSNVLNSLNKMGVLKAAGQGLQNMFNQPSLTGPGSMQAYGNMDDMYSNMPWGN